MNVSKGDVYHNWTVIGEPYCENRKTYVLCRCSCGEERIVRTDRLRNGTSKSCGCIKSPHIKDLIGHKYGNLTVIGESDKLQNGRKMVTCRCDCGNICDKVFFQVLSGKRTTCGRCNYTQIKQGDVFGRWTVIGESRIDPNSYHKQWLCQCSCENKTVRYVDEMNLKRGFSLSCGCLTGETSRNRLLVHGDKKTRLYNIWINMRDRCNNPSNSRYDDYGGRGIKVCKEWDKSYIAFKEWALDNDYQDDLTIERIDVDGNYEPSNCRWATWLEQANNKRNNLKITYNGETHTGAQWGRITGIDAHIIRKLYHKGFNMEEIILQKGVIT